MFKYIVNVNTKIGDTFTPAGGKKLVVKSISKEFELKFDSSKNHSGKLGQLAVFASCVIA